MVQRRMLHRVITFLCIYRCLLSIKASFIRLTNKVRETKERREGKKISNRPIQLSTGILSLSLHQRNVSETNNLGGKD